MSQEEKQLLLVDLSARLPYGVMVQCITESARMANASPLNETLNTVLYRYVEEDNIELKSYLRPMSSMTEEEKGELWFLLTEGRTNIELNSNGQLTTRENIELGLNYPFVCPEGSTLYVDWLNAHHFDYRGLIEKDLAVEAPEGMYSLKGK